MVTANARRTGNCHRLILNEKSAVEVEKSEMRGMNASCPSWSPPISRTCNTRSDIPTTIMRVPLQRPFDGERFRMRIKGQPILIFSSPGGRLVD